RGPALALTKGMKTLVLICLLCATASADENVGFKIPVEFRPSCAYLAQLPRPPANLTVKDFFACLTDDSRGKLDHGYRKKVARRALAGAPASLDELVAVHGDAA